MKRGGHSQQQRRIAKEAANWNMRMLAPTSEREVEQFEAWLAADPAHAKAYAESDQLALMTQRLPLTMLSSTATGRSSTPYRPAWALAAMLILVVVATLWFAGNGPPSANAALANPGPAVRGVTFQDGTAAILDSGAKLNHSSSRGVHSATIEAGRVRFDAPANAITVHVTTPQAIVAANRSIFDVALEEKSTIVRALTGVVEVTSTEGVAQSMRLRAGQAVSVSNGRLVLQARGAETVRWPASRINLVDMPLAQVAAAANRLGHPQIIFEPQAIGALKVTGVLDIRDTRPLAHKLAAALDLTVAQRGDAILLTR